MSTVPRYLNNRAMNAKRRNVVSRTARLNELRSKLLECEGATFTKAELQDFLAAVRRYLAGTYRGKESLSAFAAVAATHSCKGIVNNDREAEMVRCGLRLGICLTQFVLTRQRVHNGRKSGNPRAASGDRRLDELAHAKLRLDAQNPVKNWKRNDIAKEAGIDLGKSTRPTLQCIVARAEELCR